MSRRAGEASELVFGFATIFLPSFGQTFFISLFLVSIVTTLEMSQREFGRLYSAATLVDLPRFGRWLDTRAERAAPLLARARHSTDFPTLREEKG